MQVSTSSLVNELRENGGFTYALDGSSPRPGERRFAVAYSKDAERTFPLATFSPDHLIDFIVEFADVLECDGVHLGAWVDNEIVYLDCSLILDNEADAMKIARANDQLAIFCFENMESKCTGLTCKGGN